MNLIFSTPSKRCPFRAFNGERVEVLAVRPRRIVVRAGRIRLPEYTVATLDRDPNYAFGAIADELFLVPTERLTP